MLNKGSHVPWDHWQNALTAVQDETYNRIRKDATNFDLDIRGTCEMRGLRDRTSAREAVMHNP